MERTNIPIRCNVVVFSTHVDLALNDCLVVVFLMQTTKDRSTAVKALKQIEYVGSKVL